MRFLVVCTANVCRSPMAEGLFRHRLQQWGVDASVTSAGTKAFGMVADPYGVKAAGEIGADIAAHRPRPLTPEIVADEGRDLILTMERAHLRDVAMLDRSVWPHTFTLKEFVRRAGRVGPRPDDQSVADYLAAVHAGRTPQQLMGHDPHDDVADPIGEPLAEFRRTAAELDELVVSLLQHLRP